MEQYISKSALVAEIERRIKGLKDCYADTVEGYTVEGYAGEISDLKRLLSFMDTLEMEEVDFEKEWKEYFKYRGDVATVNLKHLVRHFFELGLKTQSKDMIEALRTEYEKGRADMIIEIEECYHKAITADAQACLIKGLLDKLKRKG